VSGWRSPGSAPLFKPVPVAFKPYGGPDANQVELGVGFRTERACWEIRCMGLCGNWGLTDESVVGWYDLPDPPAEKVK
jgi:hypothetical protein